MLDYIIRESIVVRTDDVCSTIEEKKNCSYDHLIKEAMRKLNDLSYGNVRILSLRENKYSYIVHSVENDPNTWYTMRVYELIAFIAIAPPPTESHIKHRVR